MEKVLIDIPFYTNDGDGFQCMQVGMKCVLEKYLGKQFSLEQLDKLTGRGPGQQTWTSMIVPVLHDLGLHVVYYTKLPQEPFLQGEPYIRREYKDIAQHIINTTNITVMQDAVRKLLRLNLVKSRIMPQQEMEKHLKDGHALLVTVDAAILYHNARPYHGHFVILTGYDEEYFYYHENGPALIEANKRIAKELFMKAWNAHGTDNDVVVVYGKR
jgi:hypothetical protein